MNVRDDFRTLSGWEAMQLKADLALDALQRLAGYGVGDNLFDIYCQTQVAFAASQMRQLKAMINNHERIARVCKGVADG